MDGNGNETTYQAGLGALFVGIARNVEYSFMNRVNCQLGAYRLQRGETLRVLSDGDGLFSVYVEWGEGAIARLNAEEINELAGWNMIRQNKARYEGGAQ